MSEITQLVLCLPIHLLFSPPSLPLSHVFLGVAGALQAVKAVEVPWSSDSAPRFGATFFLPSVGGYGVQFRVTAGLPMVPPQGEAGTPTT